MNPYRKLLMLGVNHLLSEGLIDLNSQADVSGHTQATLAGRDAVIQWNGIGSGELRVTVWWDYDHSNHPQANLTGNSREEFRTSTPLAKRHHYPKFVGVTASGWLERKAGKYLQGEGSSGIFDTYARRGALALLDAVPDPTPAGYQASGSFHM